LIVPDRGSFCRRFLLAQLALFIAVLLALPFAGRMLYREDGLKKSDAVFVLAGSRIVRWLEASDLVREGWAPEIALGGGYRESLEKELLARGVRIPSEGEVARSALIQLGHPPERVRILGYTDNTAEEARMLQREAVARHWSRVIVVTSKLHTRRAGIAMRRTFDGTGIAIIIRASRYDDDDPAHYWRKRRTTRSIMAEMPKFVAYWLGLAD
jgi:uncharacterized SAM-binding protein YcdF (DUF218 family)